MKTNHIKSALLGVAILLGLSSCVGTEDYDKYVENLEAMPAQIDSISSPQSYANMLDTISAKADAFDQLGVKLNDTQRDRLASLSQAIQEALDKKYNQLTQTPVTLPDAILVDVDPTAVAEGDTTQVVTM